MDIKERLVPAREVRARLGGISDMTLWRWQQNGTLPEPVKIGKRNYWPEAAVAQIVEHGASPKVQQ